MHIPRLSLRQHMALVAALVVVITILHYSTHRSHELRHLIYRELYLLPIVLAALWFGIKGGLVTSLGVTALYAPGVLWGGDASNLHVVGNLMQMGLFNGVALGLGWLRQRDLEHQQELRRAEGLAAMGRAVSCIAHDMKTPLMAIGGFARQVKRKMDPDDPDARKLELVISQVARLELMVKDMLAFARPLELDKAPHDLNQLIEESLAVMEPRAAARKVRLESDLAPDLPPVPLDRVRLQQALMNLLSNAVEAAPEGGWVRVLSRRNHGGLEVEVRDNGPGIPPDQRQEVLQPFKTTKREGTGLGLPIVRRVAEAHGGRLDIGEHSQGGARLTLVLPDSPPPP